MGLDDIFGLLSCGVLFGLAFVWAIVLLARSMLREQQRIQREDEIAGW